MLDQGVRIQRRQFLFEKTECKSKQSPTCKGFTIRVRSRKRDDTGLCSECAAWSVRQRRNEWKELKTQAGVPRSASIMPGVNEGCATCIKNYEVILAGSSGYERCEEHT